MTTIRVMSWNIESLGATKATTGDPASESEIINYINLVIRRADADIVGIMEVKSGFGGQILEWLLTKLSDSAGPGQQWLGRVSARQDGGTEEETLFLWKEEQNHLVLDRAGLPAPISSIGIVDENLLQTTFEDLRIAGNAAAQTAIQDAFLSAMETAGYLVHGTYVARGGGRQDTSTWRVNGDKWNELKTKPPPAQVGFGRTPLPVPPLTAPQLRALAAQLIGADILRFVRYSDRSPFLANFLVGNPPRKLMVAVLHAPGPQDLLRLDAINVIGLSDTAAAAANLVLMGDFNIAANQGNWKGYEYGRFPRDGHFVFARLRGQQRLVFDPIQNAPLHAGNKPLAPDEETTVIDTWVDDGVRADSVLANTFDKVFFRANGNAAAALDSSHPWAWNMIEHLAPGGTDYWQLAAQSALIYFRAFRTGAHLAKADASLARKEAKAQKAFTQASNQAANLRAKINGMNPRPTANSPLNKRLNEASAKAGKASQQRAAAQLQRAAIADALKLVNGTGTAPTGVGTALAIYREAISDHFPISLDLDT